MAASSLPQNLKTIAGNDRSEDCRQVGAEYLSDQLLDTMQVSAIFFDNDGTIFRTNAQCREDLHISEDSSGRNITDILSVICNNRDVLTELLTELDRPTINSVRLPANAFIRVNQGKNQFFVNGCISRPDPDYYLLLFRNIMEEITREQVLGMALARTKIFPWFYDTARDKMLIDAQWFSYLGIPAGDCMLSQREFFDLVHPNERTLLADALKQQLSDHEIHDSFAYRLRRGDGSWEWFSEQSMYLSQTDDGAPYRVVGVCQSIQNYKTTEEKLRVARDKAELADRLKSAFLANMSHEIRTPLNAIVGFSELLAQVNDVSEKQEYLTIIQDNNALLLQLIGDILDLSKIEAGMLDFVMSYVDVNELMDELEQMICIKSNPDISVVCTERIPGCMIRTDRNRLLQVLHNFVNNAVKFTQAGHIYFGFRQREDGYLLFYVEDTGCGIPADKIDSIFGRFVKLNNSAQGTGLGLAISKSIIERLEGEIGVHSVEGQGSVFWFVLPWEYKTEIPEITEKKQEITKEVPCEYKKTVRKITILIAEDNISNYKLIEFLLRNDYSLLHAYNGYEAVKLFDKYRPDLVLMDIKMPQMDGFQAREAIRKISEEVPVIAVTAFAFHEDELRILSAGFDGYLTKPIDGNKLYRMISELCTDKIDSKYFKE